MLGESKQDEGKTNTQDSKPTTGGLKIEGLKEEAKKCHEEGKDSPKVAHESSLKAPTRVSNNERLEQGSSNWVEYRMDGRCPDRRAYHASFVYNNCLFIHGGHDIREGTLNSLWRIDLSGRDFEWEKVSTKGINKPGKIAYHTLTLFGDHKCLLVGGSDLGIDNPNVYELDLHTMNWTLNSAQKPDEIESIDEHTACLHGDLIYIFGGNIHGYKSNTMFTYDTVNKKWKKLDTKNPPQERSSHSAVVKDDKMYIFGGKDVDNSKLGDFWTYDFNTGKWDQIKFDREEGPLSRSGHSSGVFKNFIIIYGGIHELTQELSDMYLYDVTRNTWMMVFEEEHSPVHKQYMEHNSSFSQSMKDRNSPKGADDDNLSVSRAASPEKSNREFSLNIKKAKQKKKGHRKTINFSMHMDRSKLEKLIKKRRKAERVKEEDSLLTSPTSLSMKNSFMIKSFSNNKNSNIVTNKHRRIGQMKSKSSMRRGSFKKVPNDLKNLSPGRQLGKIPGFNPKPRDGHTGIMLNNEEYVVFGGDRHHMPFNDLASIDLSLEI